MNDSDITIRKDLKIAVISMLKNLQKTGICWGEIGELQDRGGNYKRINPRTKEYVTPIF